jgi:DNA polymerase-3 subunit epsilon
MKTILIVDVETTGLDPAKDQIIELAWARWSVEYRCLMDCGSELFFADANPAEKVNGIPAGILRDTGAGSPGFGYDAIVAHNAVFDRPFFDSLDRDMQPAPWICTLEDMKWMRETPSRSLTSIALAHGCAVVAAHRAINDVLLISRLFESIPDIDARLDAALAHSLLPKAWLVACVPFELKDEAKDRDFHWDAARKEWRRYMAIADAAEFPFAVREAAA